MRGSRKLSVYLNATLFVSMILILAGQYLCFNNVFNMIEKEKDTSLSDTLVRIENVFKTDLEQLSRAQDRFNSNSYIHDYMLSNSEETRRSIEPQIVDEIMRLRSYLEQNMIVMLVDSSGQVQAFHTADEPEIDAIEDAYQLFEDTNESTILFTHEYNNSNNLYICRFKKIIHSNVQTVGVVEAGTTVFVSKMNLTALGRLVGNIGNVDLTLSMQDDLEYKVECLTSANNGKGRNYVEKIGRISQTQWVIFCRMYFSPILSSFWILIILLVLCAVGSIFMMFMIRLILNRAIVKPVQTTAGFLQSYEFHHTADELEVKGCAELEIIADSINDMIGKVKESSRASFQMQQKMYDAEISEREAVLYALQSQVNPHFLYNTLDCIRSIASIREVPEIEAITIAMSDILRYSLNSVMETSLHQEIEIVSKYITIMQIRKQQKIAFTIDLPEEIYQNKIPRLLLLTIVENTFKHGFVIKREHYMIKLSGCIKNGCVCLSVFDNGKGITPEVCDEIQRWLSEESSNLTDKRIGLLNSNRRIKLNYGEAFGLRVESEYGKYTRVILTLPDKKE